MPKPPRVITKRPRPSRAALGLALACVTLSAGARIDSPEAARGFLRRHCFECHDQAASKAGINLEDAPLDPTSPESLRLLGRVFRQIDLHEMPPAKATPPPAPDREDFLDWLGPRLRQTQPASDRVTLRRLNRVEYQNSVRDLLGIETELAELLPEDGSLLGFDKVSSALTLSPTQIEKYLEAAGAALDDVLNPGPRPKPILERYEGSDVVDRWASKSFKLVDGTTSAVLFNSAESPTDVKKFRAPAPGHYRVKLLANGHQTGGKPMKFRVYAGNFLNGGRSRLIDYHEVPALEPTQVEFVVRLDERRDTIKVVPYGSLVATIDGRTNTGPGLHVHWIEFEGPLEARDWPPTPTRQLLGSADGAKGSRADAERIVREFARRAFRRPASDEDLAPYLKLVRDRMTAGGTFSDGLRVGLTAVLVSPRFLLLQERPGPLDDHALAARLSYFLWGTLPDPELLETADKGGLRQSQTRHAQVERMLKDPRSRRFVEDFTGQWLGLRNIDFTTPDEKLYPEFDELLQVSMVRESQAFFRELLDQDLSVLLFVHSDFAMLNERLATHYGIPGVEGLPIRRVALPVNSRRGGVLTQAGVLKVTANGTTTSPVIRGAWILDRVLGKPSPPPPAGVPAAEPDIRGAVSIRDQLAHHRADPSCSSCHVRMDPLGFALENYDVIGGWRDRYRISPQPGVRVNYPKLVIRANQRDFRISLGMNVDPSDRLPDGRAFANLDALKQWLLQDPDPIARGLCEKLLIYATGHGHDPADEPALRALVQQLRKSGYGLRSLIHAIVDCELFLSK